MEPSENELDIEWWRTGFLLLLLLLPQALAARLVCLVSVDCFLFESVGTKIIGSTVRCCLISGTGTSSAFSLFLRLTTFVVDRRPFRSLVVVGLTCVFALYLLSA